MTVLGIDISAWQDINSTPQKINWKQAKEKGAKFSFIRTAYIYGKDEDFDYNWQESKKNGILRGAYHFPSYMLPAEEQAEFFWSIIENDPGEIQPVADIEYVPRTNYPQGINWMIWTEKYMKRLESLCGRKPIFYSGPDIIINYLNIQEGSWIAEYPLWIANYGVNQPMAKAVRPWGDWTFWQYSSTGDGIGFGMESKGLDMDLFNGSYDELLKFINISNNNIPDENTNNDSNEETNIPSKSIYLKYTMNVRSKPSINSPIVGRKEFGEKIDIEDLEGNDSWIKIGENEYICAKLNGTKFIEFK